MVCFRDTIVNILHRGGDNNYNSNNDDNNNHVINLSIQIKADLQPIRKIQESGHYTVKKHPFYMQANSTPDIMHCNPQSTLCTSTPSPYYAPQPPVHIMHLNLQSTLCISTPSPHKCCNPLQVMSLALFTVTAQHLQVSVYFRSRNSKSPATLSRKDFEIATLMIGEYSCCTNCVHCLTVHPIHTYIHIHIYNVCLLLDR